jgi:hypothetical protein
MVASELFKLPVISGHDISLPMLACDARDSGKGADAPGSPPPERG